MQTMHTKDLIKLYDQTVGKTDVWNNGLRFRLENILRKRGFLMNPTNVQKQMDRAGQEA
jgi:hypothetical protein